VPRILAFTGAQRAADSGVRLAFLAAALGLPLSLITARASAQPAAATEVQVRGARSDAQRLERSAEAVTVIDTRLAKQQAADLGEVLARSPGVAVQREGGLGSPTRFALNGQYDEQIRMFIDGVPLEEAGYAVGIADVPVNLIERIEVYRGVVPIRFGADALGGAVNLVTDPRLRSRLNASYQLGSFGTLRATSTGRAYDAATGFVAGGSMFLDVAKNNYEVDVGVPGSDGRVSTRTVTREHDAYRALGGHLELGVVDRAWARRLMLRAFASSQDKEYQHNQTMTAPYGALRSNNHVLGATLQHEVSLAPQLDLELLANYSHSQTNYIDTAEWVYGWSGERIRPRTLGGETDTTRKRDTLIWQDSALGRMVLAWKPAPGHAVRLAAAPRYVARSGEERITETARARDPASAERSLFTLVTGLEYQRDALGERISNIAFVKDYAYFLQSQEPPRQFLNPWRDNEANIHRFGVGDALVVRLTSWLDARASYEYATRLPAPEELFGDGDFRVLANTALQPEVSHNGNLGVRGRIDHQVLGKLAWDVTGFLRDTDRLIMLDVAASERSSQYKNINSARGVGLENSLAWTSRSGLAGLNGMLTWQDVRNTSSDGDFREFEGDRVPNQPYLFASWGGHLDWTRVFSRQDRLSPFYYGRFVKGFYRSWQSLGRPEWKLSVPDQVTHNLGLTWSHGSEDMFVTVTLEVDNLTNAKVFDVYGAQRPGRAFFLKLTGELR
jgi:vitamin B12 transporter